MLKRAVITGVGLLTPLGNSPDEFFKNAVSGQSRIGPVKKFDAAALPVQIAGEISLRGDELGISKRRLAEMPNRSQWGVLAARYAVADAKLDIQKEDPYSIAMVLGVAAPSLEIFQAQAIEVMQNGPAAARAELPILANPAIAAIHISNDLGVHGETVNITTSCASSAHSIGYAARLIQDGHCECVITGGIDEAVTPLFLSAFGNGSVLSHRNSDPLRASRPFDRQRDGYVLSDAACIFVLEEYERAKRRGVPIYCELAGYGSTCDAAMATHVAKSEEPGARAIEAALKSARMEAREIDYYCAHGTSSRWTDIRETRMIKRVFRENAARLPVSSIKSMMGHALGAAGAVQAAAAALSIRNRAIPPTINQEESDPECDLDYVPNEARALHVNSTVVYSLGMGGSNAALVLRAC